MIEASEISFGYRPGQLVIDRWSATVQRGEAVAIVGPSGSGKSTLLYILGALVRAWSGTLRIGSADVRRLGDRGRSDLRAALIGFVFQDALLDPRRSVLDNVIEGAVYAGRDRRSSMRTARALLEHMGVTVEPDRRAVDLSGGQAQRVALCRALLNEPPIVLADEPTGNLDRANAEIVEDVLLGRVHAGAAVIIVTHDEGLAARCDRIYRL